MTIADLFCGAGGTSEVACEAAIACGIVAASIRQAPDVRFLETLDAAKAA